MRCPFCNNLELKVLETRELDENSTRRRRECLKCKKRFTTYENVSLEIPVIVKRDNSKEDFSEHKITSSIVKSFDKREVPMKKVQKITRSIAAKIYSSGKKQIPSEKIGNMILTRLKKLDKMAYIRYIYVFKGLDFEKFQEEVKKL